VRVVKRGGGIRPPKTLVRVSIRAGGIGFGLVSAFVGMLIAPHRANADTI
jgi:hypothetical protein